MHDIDNVLNLPDPSQRVQKVTVDCYGQAEELSAFEVYFTDAMRFPFPAAWRDPDEPGHAKAVTVLGIDSVDQRRGVLLGVKRRDKRRFGRTGMGRRREQRQRHGSRRLLLLGRGTQRDDARLWLRLGLRRSADASVDTNGGKRR